MDKSEKMSRFFVKLLLFTLSLQTACFAKDEQERKILARVAISATVKLSPVKNCYHPPWDKGKKSFTKRLVSHSEALFQDTWSDFSFSFTPEKDGSCTLVLMGMDGGINPKTKKRRPVWVYFDNVTATGIKIKNPDFEEVNKNGTLKSWQHGAPLSDKQFAASGSNFVAVWHNKGSVQYKIKLIKGKKVTIKFKVKGAIE